MYFQEGFVERTRARARNSKETDREEQCNVGKTRAVQTIRWEVHTAEQEEEHR